jgi:hypothetical protein
LHAAWKLRIEKNAKADKRTRKKPL